MWVQRWAHQSTQADTSAAHHKNRNHKTTVHTTHNMALTSRAIAKPPNRLDGGYVPAEIKLMILEYTASHADLLSLIEAYPEWVLPLWKAYPRQLMPRAWDNALDDIDPELIAETILVYHIRKMREGYATVKGSSYETQQDRDRLENVLRDIIELSDDPMPELEPSLNTVLDLGNVVRDVNSLTYRYSNDAWKRIRHIAEETTQGPVSSTGTGPNPPEIKLTRMERLKFNRAFLRVEIYLLTKYWTNAQGERHILNMGSDIRPYIPHSEDDDERSEFDSCLRYMFHAYRRHLKMTARELGVPELPTRDDLPWVRHEREDYDYQFEDYPTFTTDDPVLNFAQRSISEEQGFLLWLCEFGIAPLEQTHQAEASERRDELIRRFGDRHSWETVKLRHRRTRYDDCVDAPLSRLHSSWSGDDLHRNRHPVMSLYGRGRRLGYATISSRWACASAFLIWSPDWSTPEGFQTRADITLNEHGTWITRSDTDSGSDNWNPFRLKDVTHHGVPHSHPYMFTHEKYEFRSQPNGVWLMPLP